MSNKNQPDSTQLTLADVVRHPEKGFPAQLALQKEFVIQRQPPMSEAGMAKLLAQLVAGPVALKPPLMELTARHPYDAAHGLVDMYMPGRWDATSDLMFMDPIVHPNPANIGEWTGSAGYVTFKPPASGRYVIVVHFYGYQITMSLNGPSGTSTASGTSNVPSAVAALFNATAGSGVGFSFACTGIYLGFVQSIQVFQL